MQTLDFSLVWKLLVGSRFMFIFINIFCPHKHPNFHQNKRQQTWAVKVKRNKTPNTTAIGSIWLKVSISALVRRQLWAGSQEHDWCFFTSAFSQTSVSSRRKFCTMLSQLSVKPTRELLALLQSLQKSPKIEKDKTEDTWSSLDLQYSIFYPIPISEHGGKLFHDWKSVNLCWKKITLL